MLHLLSFKNVHRQVRKLLKQGERESEHLTELLSFCTSG